MQTLNLRLTRDNLSRPWGFRLQGGSDTRYPLSVQRVFSGSPAEGILQRNDEIKVLDNCNVENATLKEVQEMIRTSGSQLNFIVVRDPNKQTVNNDQQNEEKISVQTARKKFSNNENRSPQPFGQFGTEFHKKSNTLPTSFMIESNHEFYNPINDSQQHKEMDDDDVADYNFMTLPVSERKKLFARPDENSSTKSVPRQRSYSFRPSQKSNQMFPKTQSALYQKKPQEFGWGPSQEKLEKARHAVPQQSTVPMKYQTNLAASPHIYRSHPEKVTPSYFSGSQTTPRSSQPNRRYSSSAMIPGQNRNNFTSSTLNFTSPSSNDRFQNQYQNDRVKSQTKYIYHCGRNNNSISTEPSIIVIPASKQPQTLYVDTYGSGNQTLSPAQSPRYFRPAYPAYSVDHSAIDNMSIISVKSEPYSKHLDRSIGYDRSGTYRILRDSSSVQRDLPYQMNTLQIGEPRTRVIANPASPSLHLNRSFWGNQANYNQDYEHPTHIYKMESSPIKIDQRPFRKAPTVPKSQSTIIMHPTKSTNDSVYTQVSWMKQHRDSMTGVSDF